MRNTYLIVILFFLFAGGSVFGQPTQDQERAIAAFDDGVQFLLDGKAKRAANSLEKAVELDPTFLPAQRMLGVAYDLNGEYQEAITAYVNVIRADSTFSRLLYYHTGDVYYRLGKPEVALKYFLKFRALQDVDRSVFGMVGEQEAAEERKILEYQLDQRIISAQISSDSANYINATEVYNLGSPINTIQNDYFPFFSNDLTSLLYTRQGAGGDEDLIRARRRDREDPFVVSRFGSFNTAQPEGMCTLVRDGETIFFTLCHEGAEQGGCDIHSGILIDGNIKETKRLPNYVNSQTWDSQAAISCDGQQLFFASTRPGGIGGSDLYRCERLADGSWSEPINLGASINTPEDEEAPFLSNDGETLYFSSMGHYNIGDQDIFFSRWDNRNQRWTAALNLGPPVNSPHRELGFHLSADGKTGFFASNRPGGEGGLDIYGFKLSHQLTGRDITYVSGYVTDSLTGEPIVNAEVPITYGATYRTNYAGRFFICAPSDRDLALTVDQEGYLPYERVFAIPSWDNLSPYRIDLLLQSDTPPAPPPPPPYVDTIVRKARVVVRNLNVLFAFEDATLTLMQIENIERFFESLKGKNIQKITVRGYTDELGTNEFNLRLSQERATAVGRYLTKIGLKANDIIMEGLGEISGSASRELNRKVEVEVRMREMVEIN